MTFTTPTRSIPEGADASAEHTKAEALSPGPEDGTPATAVSREPVPDQPRPQKQTDLAWFVSNLKRLSEELGDQFVAVKDCEIVAHADTMAGLRDEINRQGIERPLVTRTGLAAWEPVGW